LRSQVYAVTEGRGADIILDPLGGTIFEAAVRALAWRGTATRGCQGVFAVSERVPAGEAGSTAKASR
jgi:NADPH:quinone reductase-like Zn-dependent oxidoreductase